MTKSGLLLLSAVCGFLSTTYAALIDSPPGGVEELSQVLLKQLHRDVDLRLFHCTSGPNYRCPGNMPARENLVDRLAEVLWKEEKVSKPLQRLLQSATAEDISTTPAVRGRGHGKKYANTKIFLDLVKRSAANPVTSGQFDSDQPLTFKESVQLRSFFDRTLSWEKQKIRGWNSLVVGRSTSVGSSSFGSLLHTSKHAQMSPKVTFTTKLFLFFLRFGLLRGLSFDCDGTLIHSMEWYWYTWDLGLKDSLNLPLNGAAATVGVDLPEEHRFTYDSFMRVYGGQSPQRILQTLVDLGKPEEQEAELRELNPREYENLIKAKNEKIGKGNYKDILNRHPVPMTELGEILYGSSAFNKDGQAAGPVAKKPRTSATLSGASSSSTGFSPVSFDDLSFGTRPQEIKGVTEIARWLDTQYNRFAAKSLPSGPIRLAVASSADRVSLQKHLGHIGLLEHLDLLVGIKVGEKHVLEAFWPGERFAKLYLDGTKTATAKRSSTSKQKRNFATNLITSKFPSEFAKNLFPKAGSIWQKSKFVRSQAGWEVEFERDSEVSKPSKELFSTAAQLMNLEPKYLIGFEDAQNGIESLEKAQYPLIVDVTNFVSHPDIRGLVFFLNEINGGLLNLVYEVIRQYDGFHQLALVSAFDEQTTDKILDTLSKFKGEDYFENRYREKQPLKSFFQRIVYNGDVVVATGGEQQQEAASPTEDSMKAMNFNCLFSSILLDSDADLKSSSAISSSSSSSDHSVFSAASGGTASAGAGSAGSSSSFLSVDVGQRQQQAAQRELTEKAAASAYRRRSNNCKLYFPKNAPKWRIGADKAMLFVDNEVVADQGKKFGFKQVFDVRNDQKYLQLLRKNTGTISTISSSSPAIIAAPVLTTGLSNQNMITQLLENLHRERDGQRTKQTKKTLAFVFDMDGTLIDSMPVYYQFMEKVLEKYFSEDATQNKSNSAAGAQNVEQAQLAATSKSQSFQSKNKYYPSLQEFLTELAGMAPVDIWQKVIDKNCQRKSELCKRGLPSAAELFEEEKKSSPNQSQVRIPRIDVVADFVQRLNELKELALERKNVDVEFKFAVATSSSYEKAERYLKQAHLFHHFDVVFGGDDAELQYRVERLKQVERAAPGAFDINFALEKKQILWQLAAEKLGVSTKQCVAFEDAVVGMEAAYRVGYTKVFDVRNERNYPHYSAFVPFFETEYKQMFQRLRDGFVAEKEALEGRESLNVVEKKQQLARAEFFDLKVETVGEDSLPALFPQALERQLIFVEDYLKEGEERK
ncbi:unnamed protein product [Amoebophrya sp. A120]|nr:unnamed protein product [Amoebophrya sp. A120]|eukprot:GSA120T00010337001.1